MNGYHYFKSTVINNAFQLKKCIQMDLIRII